MLVFNVTDDGSIGELVREWDLFVRTVSGMLPQGIEEACRAGIAAAQPHIPVSEPRWWDKTRKPGRLKKSGRSRITSRSMFNPLGEMRWSKRYASFVDEGTTGGQVITARGGRFMRFEYKGRLYHKSEVVRGATPAAHFTDHAKKVCTDKLIERVFNAFRVGQVALRMRRSGFAL